MVFIPLEPKELWALLILRSGPHWSLPTGPEQEGPVPSTNAPSRHSTSRLGSCWKWEGHSLSVCPLPRSRNPFPVSGLWRHLEEVAEGLHTYSLTRFFTKNSTSLETWMPTFQPGASPLMQDHLLNDCARLA